MRMAVICPPWVMALAAMPPWLRICSAAAGVWALPTQFMAWAAGMSTVPNW